MKIKSVNIRGMHNAEDVTYNFQNLNYFSGPNGSGKSTAMEAIQLALLGYIPGTNKSKEAIFRHSNSNIMTVTLILDDNGTEVSIQRVWSGIKSNVVTNVIINPVEYNFVDIISDVELPIFNYSEFVGLSANKLKDWFLDFLPSANTEIDWEDILSNELQKLNIAVGSDILDDAVDEIQGFGLSGVDEVRKANEYFKTCLSFAKKDLERAQSTVQSLIFYDDVDTTIDVDEVDRKIKEVQIRKEKHLEARRASANNDLVTRDLREYEDCEFDSYELDPRYVNLSELLLSLEYKKADIQNISDLEKQCEEARKKINEKKFSVAVESKVVESKGVCPYTNSICGQVQPMIDEYKNHIDEINVEIEELEEEIASVEESIEESKNSLQTINSDILKAEKDRDYLKHRYMLRDSIKSRYQIVDETAYQDEAEFDSIIQEYNDTVVKFKANQVYSKLIDEMTSNKFKIEQNILAYKAWIALTGVNGLQAEDSASKPFWDLADIMNPYIQIVFGRDTKAWFNLESKTNSFSFGVLRSLNYIPYTMLSSGEKCMFTLSMMMGLSKMSKSPLKLIMVDDLFDHLDDGNTQSTFNALKDVEDVQMIFAGVKKVEGDFVIRVQGGN